MKRAVVYFSKTGHSRKIAEAVAAALKVRAEDIRTNPVLEDVDLLFIVGGIYGGGSDPKMLAYIDRLEPEMIKRAVLITSSGSGSGKQSKIRDTLTKNGIDVLPEEYRCKANFLLIGMGHPNKKEISDAAVFAGRLASGQKS